jgi:hypothetical protein
MAAGEARIQRGESGHHLPDARERWLDGEGISDPGARDAYCQLWDAMQEERDRLHDERLAAAERRREA